MAGDKPRQSEKFSPLSVDFIAASSGLLGSRRPVQAGVKDSYPAKRCLFTAIIFCSVKTVADSHRHAAYYNKQ